MNLLFSDGGAKPSAAIEVDLSVGRGWYATLLSKSEISGSYTLWTGDGKYDKYEASVYGGLEIWEKFRDYRDEDGYHFLNFVWGDEICGGNELEWRNSAPADFKLLIYFPDSDSFAISEAKNRYLFHSHFKADFSESGELEVTADLGRYIRSEHGMFLIRLIAALLTELLVALGFWVPLRGYWTILKINLLTQCTVNTALKILTGLLPMYSMTVAVYFLLMVGVICLENWYYSKKELFPARQSEVGVYTLVANLLAIGVISLTMMQGG